MKVILPEHTVQAMIDDARRAYPEECCGALLGFADGDDRVVARVLPIANERNSERRTRYLIGPDEYRAADAVARGDGYDVVGFYHSHPDHPAVPSQFDREHAWPWYAYVIVPVMSGVAGKPRAWRLTEDRAAFREMEFEHEAIEPIATEEAK